MIKNPYLLLEMYRKKVCETLVDDGLVGIKGPEIDKVLIKAMNKMVQLHGGGIEQEAWKQIYSYIGEVEDETV